MKDSPVQLTQSSRGTRRAKGAWVLTALLCLSGLAGLTALSQLTGCEVGNYAAYVLAGNGEKTVKVKAQYTDMDEKSFAVLVAADEFTTFNYPGAVRAIAQGVTASIAANIPGAKPMDPGTLATFQKNNPYWNTVPYSQLIARLKVDRLIVVDVVDFALRQPGNAHVWQGELVAHVGVAEADSSNGDALDFSTSVKSRFPDVSSRVGVLNSDDKTIQLGLVANFAMKTCNLFRDHEVVIK